MDRFQEIVKVALTNIDTILNVGGERGESVLSDFQNSGSDDGFSCHY